MDTTAVAYRAIATALQKRKDQVAHQPEVALATKYYKANIAKATTVDSFLKDYRLFSYAMKAYGLGDRLDSKGLVRKLLSEDPTNPKALVNTLSDQRYKALAKGFDFFRKGAGATGDPAATAKVVDRYLQQALEDKAAETNPGVKLALYFKRQAPEVASVFGILADKDLLKVVRTAFDIPEQTSAQSIDSQAAMLKKFIDPKDFKDPAKLGRFLDKFTAMYDMKASASAVATTPLSGLFSETTTVSMGADVLMALQRRR